MPFLIFHVCYSLVDGLIDNYSEDMLAGFFEGFDDCHTPILRRLVLSGMCMEAGGCNSLRTVIKNKYLPALQELLIAGIVND